MPGACFFAKLEIKTTFSLRKFIDHDCFQVPGKSHHGF